MPILGILDSAKTGRLTNFTSIATVTAAGGETSLTFSSIPGTYTDLQIRGISRNSNTGNFQSGLNIRFNSDTATNYSYHELLGNGAVASASGAANSTFIGSNNTGTAGGGGGANIFGAAIIDIADYTSTSKYKTIKMMAGVDLNSTTAVGIALDSGLWRSTSAITTISLVFPSAIVANSTFALYGIKAAS